MQNNAAFGSTKVNWFNGAATAWIATGETAAQNVEIGVLNNRINELRNAAQGQSWYPNGVMCY